MLGISTSRRIPMRRPSVSESEAHQIAEVCSDAHSFDRYRNWAACAVLLARRGFTTHEIEAVMRSKWMRWVADMTESMYGRATSLGLAHFLDTVTGTVTADGLAELVAGTPCSPRPEVLK